MLELVHARAVGSCSELGFVWEVLLVAHGCFHKLRVLSVGVLIIRALLSGVCIGAPHVWKLPHTDGTSFLKYGLRGCRINRSSRGLLGSCLLHARRQVLQRRHRHVVV